MKETHRFLQGRNCRLRRTARSIIVECTRVPGEWQHPWWITPAWVTDKAAPKGEWRVSFKPGFVNGRDAYIGDVPLTHGTPPVHPIPSWRDPVQVSGIVEGKGSSGLSLLPGEGYPKFFEELGVQPAAKGGDFNDPASGPAYDPERTRQIRAVDFYLRIPRIGTKLDYVVANPLTGQVLPKLKDKDNHVIDALRYACEGARRAAKASPQRDYTKSAAQGMAI